MVGEDGESAKARLGRSQKGDILPQLSIGTQCHLAVAHFLSFFFLWLLHIFYTIYKESISKLILCSTIEHCSLLQKLYKALYWCKTLGWIVKYIHIYIYMSFLKMFKNVLYIFNEKIIYFDSLQIYIKGWKLKSIKC